MNLDQVQVVNLMLCSSSGKCIFLFIFCSISDSVLYILPSLTCFLQSPDESLSFTPSFFLSLGLSFSPSCCIIALFFSTTDVPSRAGSGFLLNSLLSLITLHDMSAARTTYSCLRGLPDFTRQQQTLPPPSPPTSYFLPPSRFS